jgi:hypothetical protein
MKFDLKRPCSNCPFRTDIVFPLRIEKVAAIVESITLKDQSFPCHKTTSFDDDGEHIPSKKEQHCAGALIMLEKTENPNQMMRISERLGLYDATALDHNYVPVYEDGLDMLTSGPWDRSESRSMRRPAPPRIAPAPARPIIKRGPWKLPAKIISK